MLENEVHNESPRRDGHYVRPEAMTWCETNCVDYVFGLPGTKALPKKVDKVADAVLTDRAIGDKDVVRGYAGREAAQGEILGRRLSLSL